jgi:hypothetical protein
MGATMTMRSISRRLLALAVATGAVALGAPVSGASAATFPPFTFPLPATGALPLSGGLAGVNTAGTSAGCAGTNRPSIGGNTGSTSAQTCSAVLLFNGPQIGNLSSVMGPTIIGSTIIGQVNVSNGSIAQP